ncbi:helix-turn-helix transcriptional regulator [Hymenobacter humi]
MADDPTPTTLRRQLGARLRQLRQDRGETAQQVHEALGFSVSKISRMESGERAVSEQDLAALVAHYGVRASEVRELTQIARAGRQRRRPSRFVLDPEVDSTKVRQSGFMELERDAEKVREFNSGVIPGLLQSREYMYALMAAAAPDDVDALDRAVAQRLDRQRRLGGTGRYGVIVDEAVLARVVAGPELMANQMSLILHRIDENSAEVRVIPFAAGYHPGLNSVFVMLGMGDSSEAPDVVFIEGLIGHQKFDKVEDVARFERVWSELTYRSESIEGSRTLVKQYLQRYRDSA